MMKKAQSSAAWVMVFLSLSLGSCNERPKEDGGPIQHPQSHDHVMGEGLDESEQKAADDTLQREDTLQEHRINETAPEGEN